MIGPRVWSAARVGGLTGVALLVIGAAGQLTAWPLLTSTLGPTAYVFFTHPREPMSSFRNAALGHAIAITCALLALVVTGSLHLTMHPVTPPPSMRQVAAVALAVAATLAVMRALAVNHPPAAASAVLVASGLSGPGLPLLGLVAGLVALFLLQAALNLVPASRRGTET